MSLYKYCSQPNPQSLGLNPFLVVIQDCSQKAKRPIGKGFNLHSWLTDKTLETLMLS